jgi:L-ascorbate metabolism protein UlaG (beta-lactamase superfamily)
MHLLSDVAIEPLVRGWYAWPLLLAPAVTGLIMQESHYPIMESFLKGPLLHEEATSDPALAGGPFMSLPASAVPAVQSLYNETHKDYEELGGLALALRTLGLRLRERRGEALEDAYAELPPVLRGRVELTYDLENRADFRVIEPFLYSAPELALETGQSVLLRRYGARRRPFILSTPRIAGPADVWLRCPFRNEKLDRVAASRRVAVDFEELAEELGVERDEMCRVMGPGDPPGARTPVAHHRGGLRTRYLGHATLLFETEVSSVLIDPCVTFQPTGWGDWACSTAYELPERIDAVVLTHAHPDHVVLESLLELRRRTSQVIVPKSNGGKLQDPSLRLMLQNCGFESVTELDECETTGIGEIRVTALPFLGEHGDLDIRSKAAFVVAGGGRKALCVADSRNLDSGLYSELAREVGPLDALFLGMECVGAPLTWLYGALFRGGLDPRVSRERRLAGSNASEAIEIVRRLKINRAYVYAMGMEPWVWHITTVTEDPRAPQLMEAAKFVRHCREMDVDASRLRGYTDLVI